MSLNIRQIEELKYRYIEAIDTKNWELLASLLTEDCIASFDDGKYNYETRSGIILNLKNTLGQEGILSCHSCSHPQICFVDSSVARGRWYMQDTIIVPEHKFKMTGTAYYSDIYRKVDNSWKIAQTGYKRIYKTSELLPDTFKVEYSTIL